MTTLDQTKTHKDKPRTNPYVGPRTFAFQDRDFFFGREVEARDLLSLVLAERLVLFYSQSGAGKSSLVNTRLRPKLAEFGYQLLPTGRVGVGTVLPTTVKPTNIFVFNLVSGLAGDDANLLELAETSLKDYVSSAMLTLVPPVTDALLIDNENASATLTDKPNSLYPVALIIDQFEEILTSHLEAWTHRTTFFEQLRAAINDLPNLWVVLVMREDYVAALDPYARLVPGNLRTRFYMERMRVEAALEAIKVPAERYGRPFAPEVAERLVKDLCQIKVMGEVETQPGQYVEPVQLQVVCYQLWEEVTSKKPSADFITQADLRQGYIDQALRNFYENAIEKVLKELNPPGTPEGEKVLETDLRNWFSYSLITKTGTRGFVQQEPETTDDLPNRAVRLLEDHYFLIRSEIRAGGKWYELVHDRFINPIREANEKRLRQLGDEIIAAAKLQENAKLQEKAEQTRPAKHDFNLTDNGQNQRVYSGESSSRHLVKISKPVIFLAFANELDVRSNYLRNLADEERQVRRILEPAGDAGLCELVVRHYATIDEVLEVFQDYRDRIAIFHFGGHSDSYLLLEESVNASLSTADGLARFLVQMRSLVLVFINGGSTRTQAMNLLQTGVRAVIATSNAIDDRVATEFASRFYQGIAAGDNIQIAFKQAEAALKFMYGSNQSRHLRPISNIDTLNFDQWPWNLYFRPGAEEIAQWNLPMAAGDPLFGLPNPPKSDLPPSPYRHLQPFRRQDAEIFFGRSGEIRALYTRISDPESAYIILLYGQSGVGKSSLLEAGLLPRLAADFCIYYLRREQKQSLLHTLATALSENPTESDLQTAWHQKERQTGKPCLVILDQVDEVFTQPSSEIPYEVDEFIDSLHIVFGESANRPRGKVLLCFRKEFLAEIEARLRERTLPRTNVFLERLDRRGIIEAIIGVTRTQRLYKFYGLIVDEQLPEIIADDLISDPESPIAPTLQILLAKMWERAKQVNFDRPRFDLALYQELRREGLLLADFLEQQLANLHSAWPEVIDSGLVLDLLAFFTTPLGTAMEQRLTNINEMYQQHNESLPALLQHFQDLYLLVDDSRDLPGTERSSRLAHDALAPLVRRRFAESDAPGQRARRILENRAVDWLDGRVGAPLDEVDLSLIEAGMTGMRMLTSDEMRLVEASRQSRQRRSRMRRSLFWIIIVGLIISLGLGIVIGIIWQDLFIFFT